MSKINEIFVSTILPIVLPIIKLIGKAQFVEVLEGIKEHNTREVYENTLKSVHSTFKLLKEVTDKTKTKIDDFPVDMIIEAVEESAARNGVTL